MFSVFQHCLLTYVFSPLGETTFQLIGVRNLHYTSEERWTEIAFTLIAAVGWLAIWWKLWKSCSSTWLIRVASGSVWRIRTAREKTEIATDKVVKRAHWYLQGKVCAGLCKRDMKRLYPTGSSRLAVSFVYDVHYWMSLRFTTSPTIFEEWPDPSLPRIWLRFNCQVIRAHRR